MNPCVYLIRNLVNGKVYVGKTNNAQHRWVQHVSASKRDHHHMPVVRAIKKYGPKNFTFEILESFDTESEALRAESCWISHYESNDPTKGYNLDGGGLGGKTLSASTRAKLSLAHRGKPKSPEHVIKMADTLRGRTLSPETRSRMSLARLGQKRDPAIGEKVSLALRGKPLTPETKAKMAVARQGRKLSPEHVAKVAAANTGKKRTLAVRIKIAEAARQRTPHKQTPEIRARIAEAVRVHKAKQKLAKV